MTRGFVVTGAMLLASAFAFGEAMPCDTLKAKIEDSLKAKGVQNYTLTVVGSTETGTGKVVGTCDGGTKKIYYSREAAAPAASEEKPATPAKKPAPAK